MPTHSAIDAYKRAVEAHVAAGKSRAEAEREVARQSPAVHRALLIAFDHRRSAPF